MAPCCLARACVHCCWTDWQKSGRKLYITKSFWMASFCCNGCASSSCSMQITMLLSRSGQSCIHSFNHYKYVLIPSLANPAYRFMLRQLRAKSHDASVLHIQGKTDNARSKAARMILLSCSRLQVNESHVCYNL